MSLGQALSFNWLRKGGEGGREAEHRHDFDDLTPAINMPVTDHRFLQQVGLLKMIERQPEQFICHIRWERKLLL